MKATREAAYQFLSALADDFPDFEEATQDLLARNTEGFAELMKAWPSDIKNLALKLTALD